MHRISAVGKVPSEATARSTTSWASWKSKPSRRVTMNRLSSKSYPLDAPAVSRSKLVGWV